MGKAKQKRNDSKTQLIKIDSKNSFAKSQSDGKFAYVQGYKEKCPPENEDEHNRHKSKLMHL